LQRSLFTAPFLSVIFLTLVLCVALSPFNTFLRSKCFSDGYRWRGFDKRDIVPLVKTLVLIVSFSAGAVYSALDFLHVNGRLAATFIVLMAAGLFGNVIFSVWYSLRKAQRARRVRKSPQSTADHP